MSPAQVKKAGLSGGAVLAMLVISVCLSYVDRGSLSIAAPKVAEEMHLDKAQMGTLFSAFFATYAAFQIPSGWLVDRYGVKIVLSVGFFIWSVATGLIGLATGFTSLLVYRLLLGMGESVAYPAYSKVIAATFPKERRGLPNACIDAGANLGPALGTVIGGLVIAQYGWRSLFVAAGVGGLLWLLPWTRFRPAQEQNASGQAIAHQGPGFGEILTKKAAWGTFLGLFCFNSTKYFLLSWYPLYLVEARHFSIQKMAIVGSLPFWGLAVTSLAGGWLSDHLVMRGFSPTKVRKAFLIAGLLMGTSLMASYVIESETASLGIMLFAALSMGFYTSNVWAVTQVLSGPEAAGKWSGLQNACGNVGGVVSPLVAGLLVKSTGTYFSAFAAASGIMVLGACCYLFLVGKVEPVRWKARG